MFSTRRLYNDVIGEVGHVHVLRGVSK